MIAFTVLGVPVPQGSMVAFISKHMPYPQVKADNEKALRPWRRRIAMAARASAKGATAAPGIPVQVRLTFRMPRPKVMPKGRIAPTVTPDIDKLLRACLDALTLAGIYHDDAQVIDTHAIKLYATPERPPGVYVEVEFMSLGLEAAS